MGMIFWVMVAIVSSTLLMIQYDLTKKQRIQEEKLKYRIRYLENVINSMMNNQNHQQEQQMQHQNQQMQHQNQQMQHQNQQQMQHQNQQQNPFAQNQQMQQNPFAQNQHNQQQNQQMQQKQLSHTQPVQQREITKNVNNKVVKQSKFSLLVKKSRILERNNILLIVGAFIFSFAGFIFATTSWENITSVAKLLIVLAFAFFMYVLSLLSTKILHFEFGSHIFYLLGTIFASTTVIAIGYFAIFGELFDFVGQSSYSVISVSLILFSILAFIGSLLKRSYLLKLVSITLIFPSTLLLCLGLVSNFIVLGVLVLILSLLNIIMVMHVNLGLDSKARFIIFIFNAILCGLIIILVSNNTIFSNIVIVIYILTLYAKIYDSKINIVTYLATILLMQRLIQFEMFETLIANITISAVLVSIVVNVLAFIYVDRRMLFRAIGVLFASIGMFSSFILDNMIIALILLYVSTILVSYFLFIFNNFTKKYVMNFIIVAVCASIFKFYEYTIYAQIVLSLIMIGVFIQYIFKKSIFVTSTSLITGILLPTLITYILFNDNNYYIFCSVISLLAISTIILTIEYYIVSLKYILGACVPILLTITFILLFYIFILDYDYLASVLVLVFGLAAFIFNRRNCTTREFYLKNAFHVFFVAFILINIYYILYGYLRFEFIIELVVITLLFAMYFIKQYKHKILMYVNAGFTVLFALAYVILVDLRFSIEFHFYRGHIFSLSIVYCTVVLLVLYILRNFEKVKILLNVFIPIALVLSILYIKYVFNIYFMVLVLSTTIYFISVKMKNLVYNIISSIYVVGSIYLTVNYYLERYVLDISIIDSSFSLVFIYFVIIAISFTNIRYKFKYPYLNYIKILSIIIPMLSVEDLWVSMLILGLHFIFISNEVKLVVYRKIMYSLAALAIAIVPFTFSYGNLGIFNIHIDLVKYSILIVFGIVVNKIWNYKYNEAFNIYYYTLSLAASFILATIYLVDGTILDFTILIIFNIALYLYTVYQKIQFGYVVHALFIVVCINRIISTFTINEILALVVIAALVIVSRLVFLVKGKSSFLVFHLSAAILFSQFISFSLSTLLIIFAIYIMTFYRYYKNIFVDKGILSIFATLTALSIISKYFVFFGINVFGLEFGVLIMIALSIIYVLIWKCVSSVVLYVPFTIVSASMFLLFMSSVFGSEFFDSLFLTLFTIIVLVYSLVTKKLLYLFSSITTLLISVIVSSIAYWSSVIWWIVVLVVGGVLITVAFFTEIKNIRKNSIAKAGLRDIVSNWNKV